MALLPPRYCLPAAYREEDLMPSRGSAQFLLLLLRSRRSLGWMMGAIACALIVAVLLQAGGEFPLLSRTGLAQLLRQSAWEHALAGLPAAPPLPWADSPTAAGQGATARLKRIGDQGYEPRPSDGQIRWRGKISICRAPSSARLASATISPSPRPTAPRAIIASPGARWSIRIWPISRGRRIWMRR